MCVVQRSICDVWHGSGDACDREQPVLEQDDEGDVRHVSRVAGVTCDV
jgi:hypothetical protein